MDMESGSTPKECTSWNIRKLDDGKFVMSSQDGEYGYDTLDELISDLKEETSGDSSEKDGEVEANEKKNNVKKIMEADNEGE